MQPSAEAIANNKKTALEQLRFSRQQNSSSSIHSTASSSSGYGTVALPYAPPAQSRDATVASRFFPSTPTSNGTILVPSSSPLTSEGNHNLYQPRSDYHGNDVAYSLSANPSHAWGQHHRMSEDPLSAPSGFISTGSHNHASLRRPWDGDSDLVGGMEEGGRARKRINLGSTRDASDVVTSPPSPDVQRPSQRRRILTHTVDNHSTSSDDSLPDISKILAGPSKPRIMRGRSPSPDTSTILDPISDPKFIRFKLTMPMESPGRVQAAWVLARGDVKKATELLSDPLWVAPSSPAAARSDKDAIGRVREIEEANKAQKVAAREKGKKSLIYANRPVLEVKPHSVSTPPVKRVVDLTAETPTSPETPIAMPRRTRIKKMVVESDSEGNLTESDDDDMQGKRGRQENAKEIRALEYFNTTSADALQELTGCTREQAATIFQLRPYESIDDLNTKLGQGKKKAGPAGISPRMFEECQNIFEEYAVVDNILEDCEQIGATLRAAIATWTTTPAQWKGKASEDCTMPSTISNADDGALSLVALESVKSQKSADYLVTQPSLLAKTVELKEYQLLGVNWLHLLYRSKLSCILADEMGLGKTIQVISFLAYLKEKGNKGPHLIVVPSSTLENWCREFARFAPSIAVQTYYAGKGERIELRQTLIDSQRCRSANDEGWEVLITTYNLAQGDDRDRKFFRRIDWDSCVYDEGHVLKNFQSQRYQSLLKFGSKWRLLLTGTPLQNNLQELVSLMNFILPHHFAESIHSLRAIFKVKGDSKVSLLAQERVSRAKKMMTPFVLRRRKDQVLKDLPKKTERIEWCIMTELQQSIYRDALQRSRKTVLDETAANDTEVSSTKGRSEPAKKKLRTNGRPKDKMYLENSSNVLMDLRKAASHPMLFRTLFTDARLSGITKQLLKEPDFKKRGALFDLVKEDMSVMTDAELQIFCATYKSTRKYLQDENCYLDAGKVQVLMKLLANYRQEGRKVLVFSQFTQILDILQAILKHDSINYLILTGNTPVDVRQTLVDEFTEDQSIPVFLLSTKAGGMGINLTAASVVIMFDQDFNPHNDRQAQDRAYRIGQKRDVEVVKLISRGTIEEDMLKLGETKLALDEAVAGDTEKEESAPEREMKTSLMNVLRQQFEKQQGRTGSEDST
ncbi:SNF2 family N-terminal domain-containing protein [Lyophyllum atratum]|nr:SNF2 family N-terminal domain-containing protein [Lyophyllum atratum]